MSPKRKVVSTVNGDNKRRKCAEKYQWHTAGKTDSKGIPSMSYFYSNDVKGSSKIAAFDFDWTIAGVKSKSKFPKNADDWVFLYDCVPKMLGELHEKEYAVVIFSNQAGVTKGKASLPELQRKYENVIDELGIPILVFISTGENEWRKPNIKMWEFFVQKCNNGVDPNLKECFYVGDAAGRPKNWQPGKPKDFSCSDRMFAANIGIDFKTPEEFFLHQKPYIEFSWGTTNPKEYLKTVIEENKSYHTNEREMILLCGPPGSGKSTFAACYFEPHGYTIVNRDLLGTQNKCIQLAKQSLTGGKSVVIDNTNPSKAARKEYIQLAAAAGVPVRCFVLNVPFELCTHMNNVRAVLSDGAVKKVPKIAYNMYKSQFSDPELSEGISSIEKVDFQPKFDSEEHKKVFLMWTAA